LYFVQLEVQIVARLKYRDKKVVSVFVRFRAPLQSMTTLNAIVSKQLRFQKKKWIL
jgi:hypothetical protein